MRTTVSFVIRLMDDFTGMPVTDHFVRVYASGTGAPIRKGDGYYVFTNCVGRVWVSVRSPYYYEERTQIDTSEEKATVHQLWLHPNRQYRLPEGVVCIAGSAAPESSIGVVIEREENCMKLLHDYSKKKDACMLELFYPGGTELSGRQFLIASRDGKCREFFSAVGAAKRGCLLSAPLSQDYKRTETKIYRCYCTRADEKGDYFLPIKEALREKAPCRFWVGDRETEGEIEPGITNIRNF